MNRVMHIGWERDASGRLMPKEAYFLSQHRITPDQRVKWDEVSDEIIRRFAIDGKSAREAGIEIGRSRSSVISRAKRIGVTFASIPSSGSRAAWGSLQPRRVADKARKAMGLSMAKATPEISAEKQKTLDQREAVSLALSADWQPERIGFMDLKPRHCRFPLWKSGAAFSEKFYCGLDALPSQSFCAHCYGISYNAKHTGDMDRRLNLKKLGALS